jgi:hypothetical protein
MSYEFYANMPLEQRIVAIGERTKYSVMTFLEAREHALLITQLMDAGLLPSHIGHQLSKDAWGEVAKVAGIITVSVMKRTVASDGFGDNIYMLRMVAKETLTATVDIEQWAQAYVLEMLEDGEYQVMTDLVPLVTVVRVNDTVAIYHPPRFKYDSLSGMLYRNM